jgi:AbrB family looped-hinge helix DNA binding protein
LFPLVRISPEFSDLFGIAEGPQSSFDGDISLILPTLALLFAIWHDIMAIRQEDSMKTTLDRFGRIVLPKEIRDRFGLHPGADLEIDEQGDAVVLKPAGREAPLKMEDGVLVYAGTARGDLADAVRLHRKEQLLKKATFGKKP